MSELWSEDIRDSEFGARSQTINDDYVHLKGNLPPNETEE